MKFRWKITLCMLGLLSVLFGAGGSMLINLSFRDSLERERSAAYNSYQAVLGTLRLVNGVSQKLDYEDLADMLAQLSGQSAGSWTALRLYSSQRSIYAEGVFPENTSAAAPAEGRCAIRYGGGDGAHLLIVSGALEAGGEALRLDMACDVSALFEARESQERVYHGVFLLLMGLCAVLSYSVSLLLTRPLSELSRAARAISAGRLSRRVRVRSSDEIGLAAREFNRMAEALEANISELTASMERQERFIGSFAHEVKTPMTSVIGYADLIRGDTLDEEERREAANFIVSEGRRMERLSRKLLELLVTKQGGAELTPASPAAIIRGLAAHLGPIYEKQGITLTCRCEQGRCLLEPDLVRSLLINLWDNARKAMEGAGGTIRVQSVMLPDGCRITVADDGKGIPPESLSKLTEAFYRVDKARSRAQGGAGLGLALCGEIAQAHHGGIRFESEPGRGTAAIVELRGGAA